MFAIAEENGGRNLTQTLFAGETVVIPQGLLHSFHNDHCEPAAFVDFYANSDPGIQGSWANFLKMPEAAILATTGMSSLQLQQLRDTYPGGPFSYDYACAKRCNITDIRSSSAGPGTGGPDTRTLPVSKATTQVAG